MERIGRIARISLLRGEIRYDTYRPRISDTYRYGRYGLLSREAPMGRYSSFGRDNSWATTFIFQPPPHRLRAARLPIHDVSAGEPSA
jgi:hypothetical protein